MPDIDDRLRHTARQMAREVSSEGAFERVESKMRRRRALQRAKLVVLTVVVIAAVSVLFVGLKGLLRTTPTSHGPAVPTGEIAFSKANGIYLARADGTIIRRLTDVPGDDQPSWSPNGAQFAFVRFRHGTGSIYVADAYGNGIRLVVRDAYSPAWSPDGTQIAFTKEIAIKVGHGGGGCGLYLMHPDGSDVRLVTNRLCPYGISWSPDAAQIAFAGFPGYDPNGPLPIKIDIIRPDGTGLRSMSAGPTNDVSPSWSPAGKQIVFESDSGGYSTGSIVIVNADGSNARRFTPGDLLVYSPTWSPDGQWLAYASGKTSTTVSIFLMRPDFSDIRRITSPSGSGAYPAWRPSGP